MTAPVITIPQVLRRAAEILQVNGRWVGAFWDGQQAAAGTPIAGCRVCVSTAIVLAAGADAERFAGGQDDDTPGGQLALAAVRAMKEHLALAPGPDHTDPIMTLYYWHDGGPGDIPTDEQVIAALTETADAYEQAGGAE